MPLCLPDLAVTWTTSASTRRSRVWWSPPELSIPKAPQSSSAVRKSPKIATAQRSRRTPSPTKAFQPLNTLSSTRQPSFAPQKLELELDTMVQERNPSRTSSGQYLSPQEKTAHLQRERTPLANISAKMQSPSPKNRSSDVDDDDVTAFLGKPPPQAAHEYGKASPLRIPSQQRKGQSSVFIPRKVPVSRQYASSAAQQASQTGAINFPLPPPPPPAPQPAPANAFSRPGEKPQTGGALTTDQTTWNSVNSGFYRPGTQAPTPIYPPYNAPRSNVLPPPRPMYSSVGPNTQFQHFPAQPPRQVPPAVDLTKQDNDDDNSFDPDAQIRAESGKFGQPDLYAYVDSSQANENIKGLLEGAFDDDNADKSRVRLRRRAKKAAKEGKEKEARSLADRLASLKVEDQKKAGEDAELEAEDEEEEDGTVEGLSVKLLPHQVEGVSWMIDKECGQRKTRGVLPYGGILADDMGLGKTVQSVALLLTNPRPAPDAKPDYPKQKMPGNEVGKGTLVVAPLALIKQWEHEIKDKVEKKYAMKVLVHHGPNRTKSAAELKKYDVVISTYQTLTSEHAASNMTVEGGSRIGCMGVHWYRLILDEAHSIKNRNAKSTQACYALNSWYRWCLTGTPMQNNLDELQSLIKFLRIKPYCELPRWKEAITQPMKNGRGGLAIKRLQVFLRAFMKRRTKDILKKDGALNFGGKAKAGEAGEKESGGMQIVKREVLTIECDFDDSERRLYTSMQDRADERLREMERSGKGNDYIGALVLLLRLRQMCDHHHLIDLNVNKDNDALMTGTSQKKGGGDEMDDLAAMMDGISVEQKKCDVCQAKLSAEQSREGAVRCIECTADLLMMKQSKREKKQKIKQEKAAASRRRAHQLPPDSEDENEEGEGEWIAKQPERCHDLGRAGGSDDEDAEGGGETLNSIDTDRSEDVDSSIDDSLPRAHTCKCVVKHEDTDESDANVSIDVNRLRRANHKKHLDSHTHGGDVEPSTKIRRLLRILHAERPKHKTIVFSQFTTMLDLIEPHLHEAGVAYARYDGSMRNDAREASLDSLRNNPETRVLLCSLKCGSLGLNLTAASRVVIVEPFWNPFVEEQAIDRVHRLNQTVDVKVYRLTIRDTVEARILELQERKRELAKAAIEGAATNVNKLSMQEILGLFRHDGGGHQHDDEDKALWQKFGGDARLLDGGANSSGSSGSQDPTSTESQGNRMVSGGKPKAKYQESGVYGRRW